MRQTERRLDNGRERITKKYMPASAVMTVRIDPALLGALKAKARRDGRSLSAAVIQLIRLGVEPERPAGKVHTMGMFPDFEAPDLDELVALRRSFSRTLKPKSKKRA